MKIDKFLLLMSDEVYYHPSNSVSKLNFKIHRNFMMVKLVTSAVFQGLLSSNHIYLKKIVKQLPLIDSFVY